MYEFRAIVSEVSSFVGNPVYQTCSIDLTRAF